MNQLLNEDIPIKTGLPPALQWPVEDIAVSHALGNYLCGSHFNYMPALYASSTKSPLLRSALTAVGLAAVSQRVKCHELEKACSLRYLDAINKTNSALRSAKAVANDDVLGSIMLLALFETLRSHTTNQAKAWNTHVQGALALVTLRGPAQLQTQLGRALFKQVSDSVSVYCVQNFQRVPVHLRRLAALVSNSIDTNFGFDAIVDDFTNLRADLVGSIAISPTEVVVRAKQILRRLEYITTMLPFSWLPQVMRVTKSETVVYGNYYYKYTDQATAQLWNTIWMTKVLLNSLIRDQVTRAIDSNLMALSSERGLAGLADTAQKDAIAAADAICASVPSFFPPTADKCSQERPAEIACGYFLIWPLFVVGSCSLVPIAMKGYVIERLTYISTSLALPQARKAAAALENDSPSRDSNW
jgi:hypothetical protein